MAYYQPECLKCNEIFNITNSKKDNICEECGHKLSFEIVTEPDDIINYLEGELENANRHNIEVTSLWNSMKRFINKNERLIAVEALGEWVESIL